MILVLVIFLLSNRTEVSLGFWPTDLALAVPLGAVTVAILVLGFLLGLLFHLPHRMSATRRARRAERRVAELEARTAPPAL